MSEIGLGTMYEMNKTAMAKEPILTKKEKKEKWEELKRYFRRGTDYALLCREKYDFTVFRISNSVETAIQELEGVLNNRGTIISIDKQSDGSYEVWMKDSVLVAEPEIFMYKMFPCEWVIDC